MIVKQEKKKPEWSREVQADPPYFGQAVMVSEKILQKEINKRRNKCLKIIQSNSKDISFKNGLVSIIVLSCKRPKALKRLCESLMPFLINVETYNPIEVILVDNGSGQEVLDYAESLDFFNDIISFENNLGMVGALRYVYPRVQGEYILFVEDDFVLVYETPFLQKCLSLFKEYPEIGIIRLKNQNNWWKSYRRIAPLRKTSDGTDFWTWLPSRGRYPLTSGSLNVWTAGSVLFRKISYIATGELPDGPNYVRSKKRHQGMLYEEVYGKKYNKTWLAAKVDNCYPFYQPNDEDACAGWGEIYAVVQTRRK